MHDVISLYFLQHTDRFPVSRRSMTVLAGLGGGGPCGLPGVHAVVDVDSLLRLHIIAICESSYDLPE